MEKIYDTIENKRILYCGPGPLKKAFPTDTGYDLAAKVEKDTIIPPGKHKVIPTGFFLIFPPGIDGQIRPRSGLAAKQGITVLNSPGTIDNSYRGELKVIIINHSGKEFLRKNGDRVAQLVFSKVEDSTVQSISNRQWTKITLKEEEDSLINQEDQRMSRGFGSTGIQPL